MSKYGWMITRDHIDDGHSEGRSGPSNLSDAFAAQLDAETDVESFKIFDDDGELYYEGHIVGDYSGFEPLDDYGMPNAGATEIHYLNRDSGVWEPL